MFRPDKKLKRKRAWKRWRKARNILENWLKEEKNRTDAGLSRRNLPVEFTQRKKYPSKEMSPAQRKELMNKLMKITREKAAKQKAASRVQKFVLKLKQLWQKTLNLLKKIRKK